MNAPCCLCSAPATRHTRSITQGPLCTACVAALPWYASSRCPQCALPTLHDATCGICLQHPPAFDRTLAIFRYAYPLDHLLHQFKYHQHLAIGKWLAESMLSALPPQLTEIRPDILLAMPMHAHRLRQRGFNHALELARHLQQTLGIPLDIDGCIRILDTPSQTGMELKTRIRNLRGAFASPTQWQGKHVMVVDDVMTTGASMHAVSQVLKQAGAGRVTALVFARTLKDTED